MNTDFEKINISHLRDIGQNLIQSYYNTRQTCTVHGAQWPPIIPNEPPSDAMMPWAHRTILGPCDYPGEGNEFLDAKQL